MHGAFQAQNIAIQIEVRGYRQIHSWQIHCILQYTTPPSTHWSKNGKAVVRLIHLQSILDFVFATLRTVFMEILS